GADVGESSAGAERVRPALGFCVSRERRFIWQPAETSRAPDRESADFRRRSLRPRRFGGGIALRRAAPRAGAGDGPLRRVRAGSSRPGGGAFGVGGGG